MRQFTAREIELAKELVELVDRMYDPPDGEMTKISETEYIFVPYLHVALQEIRRRGWSIEDHYDSDGCIFISVGRQGENRLDLEQAYGATDLEAALQCLIEIIRKEQ